MKKIWLALIVLFSFYIFLPYSAFAQSDGWFLPYKTYQLGQAFAHEIAVFYQNTSDPNKTLDPLDYIPTTYSAKSVRSADINSDGNTDIVVISTEGSQHYVEVLLQDDFGNLADPVVI
ncbi:MAG: hypothetical protein JSV88_03060 [Candidatus Aminicenantes bacterium]|nr:MAG: hypothetical protein JSV88_03060 [Candidatus Aminicenantes bacterium]